MIRLPQRVSYFIFLSKVMPDHQLLPVPTGELLHFLVKSYARSPAPSPSWISTTCKIVKDSRKRCCLPVIVQLPGLSRFLFHTTIGYVEESVLDLFLRPGFPHACIHVNASISSWNPKIQSPILFRMTLPMPPWFFWKASSTLSLNHPAHGLCQLVLQVIFLKGLLSLLARRTNSVACLMIKGIVT